VSEFAECSVFDLQAIDPGRLTLAASEAEAHGRNSARLAPAGETGEDFRFGQSSIGPSTSSAKISPAGVMTNSRRTPSDGTATSTS
jgi:hypothetical protein